MWKPADALTVTEEQRRTLDIWARAKTTPQRVVLRSRICLLATDGISHNAIAKRLNTSRPTVLLWTNRFREQGPPGLSEDAPHGESPRRLPVEKVREIVEATLHTTPREATHWSTRTLARAQGVSNATVARIWDAHGLQPHRVKTFKLSKDKRFVEKLTDVVGVYLNPPDKAVVLCVDEKSQIQALDRTQPGLPMKKGRCGTMTHDYKRNGTTCLFAALNVLEGKVIGSCYPRHRNGEFLEISAQDRPRNTPEPGRPHDSGQLRNSRSPERESLAGQTSSLRSSLYADECVVAEPGRALVRGDHAKTNSPRCVPKRAGTGGGDRGIHSMS